MRLTYNNQERPKHGLVTIKPGKYPVVGTDDRIFDISSDTHGMTLEHVGYHTDNASCWHVLIDNNVLLVWDHDMVTS